MILKSSIIGAIFLGFFGFKTMNHALPTSNPPGDTKEAMIITALLNYVDQVHFDPKPVDDKMSTFVFKNYLEKIDGGKRYFTQEDVNALKQYELTIDDQTNARSFEFFDQSVALLDTRLVQVEGFYNEIINQPFDLHQKKIIELDDEKKPYAKNDSELKEYWREFLTYEVVSRLDRKINDQEKKEDKTAPKKSQKELEEEVIKEMKKTFGDWFARLKKLRRSDRFESYVGSITNYFDPHTDYFSPKEKQDFDINMGGKLEGIGARLQQDGDFIKISSIITGGPAWKGKELVEGDIILSSAQEGKDAVDLTGMRVDDAVQHIRGKKGTKVTLNIKKTDGTLKTITIVRDEVIIDESFARSAIIEIPGVINNVGYIKLPKFYSSFEKTDGNSCAADVAKEVQKLKSNNVNGIILDLRNNTGGSLNDVVDMSGLFIEQGPIVQVKSRQAKPYLHMDRDESVQYDGPFIILVNAMSASASEIIAAAMQDYKRAVIVGGNTFGKGTVQRFFDLDRAVGGNEELKPLGEIKMSVQKFFRVNGGSTQLKGVAPDIVLPDNYMYIDAGEKEYENAMPYSEIQPQNFSQNVAIIENMKMLKDKSVLRVKSDQRFMDIEKNAMRYKTNKDDTKSNLSLEEYSVKMDALEKEAKQYESLFKEDIKGLSVKNLPQDISTIEADASKKARNDEWLKDMKKDPYLNEGLMIMKDMITGEKTFAYLKDKIK